MNRRTASASLAACLALFATSTLADIDNARQSELMHLLVQDCGSCHGLTMKGGLGPALLPDNLKDKPTALLVATILDGREGTAMPPWKAMLDKHEADWIVQKLQAGLQ